MRRSLLALGCGSGLAVLILATFIAALTLRASVLVTPSETVPVNAIAIAGAVFGALFGATTSLRLPTKRSRLRLVNLIWATPLFALAGGAIFDELAWDGANVLAFRGSDAPIILTAFPIRSFGEGRGGPYASTGGQGLPTGHMITQADYAILSAAGRPRRPWRYCLPLYRQQEGNAVRVFLQRSIPRSQTQRTVTIVECPAYVRRA